MASNRFYDTGIVGAPNFSGGLDWISNAAKSGANSLVNTLERRSNGMKMGNDVVGRNSPGNQSIAGYFFGGDSQPTFEGPNALAQRAAAREALSQYGQNAVPELPILSLGNEKPPAFEGPNALSQRAASREALGQYGQNVPQFPFLSLGGEGSGSAQDIYSLAKPQAPNMAATIQQRLDGSAREMAKYSNTSDAGLPYYANGDTVKFTNPDGSGRGSVTAPGLAGKMSDGKGSLSIMHLESPYGNQPAGLPGLAGTQAQQYQAPQLNVPQYDDSLELKPSYNKNSIDSILAYKRDMKQRNAERDFGLRQQELALNQAKDQANLGLNYVQLNQGAQHQAFQNQLGLANYAQDQAKMDNQLGLDQKRLALDEQKQKFNENSTDYGAYTDFNGEQQIYPKSGPIAEMQYQVGQGIAQKNADPHYVDGLKKVLELSSGKPQNEVDAAKARYESLYREYLVEQYMKGKNGQ